MLEIINEKQLATVKSSMRVIQPEMFDQFATKMLNWYLTQTHSDFFREGTKEIPNVFDLFNYPGLQGEQVLYLFIDSETERRMNYYGETSSMAKDKVIDEMKDYGKLVYERMMGDAISMMDTYHLFYMYKDDVHNDSIYYNKFAVEVW